jgi:glycosyltransferase involved in cell wall biosynthesis
MTHLSVVIPVYNEESLINELFKRVTNNLKLITESFEIIIVDDGSEDGTWELIENESRFEKRIKGIKFSRNFGHHYAITAGLDHANGEWVIVMDGDLQDRPEVIIDLYRKSQEGYDVVFVSRMNRPEKLYYRILQKFFYWILNNLSGLNFDSRQANYSIISKKVVFEFRKFSENARFYVSTIKWLGFKTGNILADHGVRHSGKTSYSIRKRFKLALDIIISFADRPLKFAIGLGIGMSTFSIFLALWIIYGSFKWGFSEIGWASIITSIFFSTGTILIILGILGMYINDIFKQVKNRPLFIVEEFKNLNNEK